MNNNPPCFQGGNLTNFKNLFFICIFDFKLLNLSVKTTQIWELKKERNTI